MARKMTKLLRNIATAFSIIVASQVAASDSVVALVCNIEKPDYLVFLDFDKSKFGDGHSTTTTTTTTFSAVPSK